MNTVCLMPEEGSVYGLYDEQAKTFCTLLVFAVTCVVASAGPALRGIYKQENKVTFKPAIRNYYNLV